MLRSIFKLKKIAKTKQSEAHRLTPSPRYVLQKFGVSLPHPSYTSCAMESLCSKKISSCCLVEVVENYLQIFLKKSQGKKIALANSHYKDPYCPDTKKIVRGE